MVIDLQFHKGIFNFQMLADAVSSEDDRVMDTAEPDEGISAASDDDTNSKSQITQLFLCSAQSVTITCNSP